MTKPHFYLLQCCGFVSRDKPAHDNVFQQNNLERWQDGTAVQHWGGKSSSVSEVKATRTSQPHGLPAPSQLPQSQVPQEDFNTKIPLRKSLAGPPGVRRASTLPCSSTTCHGEDGIGLNKKHHHHKPNNSTKTTMPELSGARVWAPVKEKHYRESKAWKTKYTDNQKGSMNTCVFTAPFTELQ